MSKIFHTFGTLETFGDFVFAIEFIGLAMFCLKDFLIDSMTVCLFEISHASQQYCGHVEPLNLWNITLLEANDNKIKNKLIYLH